MSETKKTPWFYSGALAKYSEELHGQDVYFATDEDVFILRGRKFRLPDFDKNAVQSVDLSADESKIVITYLDGTTEEIEAAKSEYESAIEDKSLEMPTAVGGIAKGTKLSDIEGKSFNAILDDLLFPTVVPTFVAPTASIKLNGYSATQEVGATAPTEANFTVAYNAGAINLNGVKQANRGGAQDVDNSFIYYGTSADNKTLPTAVTLGATTYKYRAAYGEGAQPKDNKGNDYGTPLAAGYVDSSAVSVNGTYPWYASTASASADTPVVKQALVAWNATAGAMSTGNFVLQPSGTLPQVFKLPRQLKTLQMLNTVSNQMETIGTSDYTETTETISINGNDVTYYVYTYNGATRGSVTLLAKF